MAITTLAKIIGSDLGTNTPELSLSLKSPMSSNHKLYKQRPLA